MNSLFYRVPFSASFSRVSGDTRIETPLLFGWITTPRRALPIAMLSTNGTVMPGGIAKGSVVSSQGVTPQHMTNCIKTE